MSEDHRRALQRFVAGLDVDADALAAAITARALEETVVDEALLQNLGSDEAVVQRRAARRIARMDAVGPRVAARLAVIAGTQPDETTRAAAAEALRAHGLPVPGETEPTATPGRRRTVLTALRLELRGVRAGKPEVAIGPLLTSHAPYLGGRLRSVAGAARVELAGLPAAFTGTYPALVVDGEEIARAAAPVSADGAVVIDIELAAGSFEELERRLRVFDLVVHDT
jgi:hypothetical protein